MAFDVIIGRSKHDVKKYGKRGTIFIAKQFVKMGQTTALSNPVYLDVAGAHVIFLCGKRGSGKCLHGDTLIQLDSGEQVKIKNLEGQENKTKILTLNKNNQITPTVFTHFYQREVKTLLKLTLKSNKQIKLTPEHPLLTKKGWQAAQTLPIQTQIAVPKESKQNSEAIWDQITKIELLEGNFEVYDLTVPNTHNFIANNIIVHNSYTMGSIAEGLADLPKEVKQNLSIVLFDTMGIYWTMKYPNYQDAPLLKKWGFDPKSLDVKIYTPSGFYYKYKEEGIPTDFPFSISPLDVGPEDWLETFKIESNTAEGVLISKIVLNTNNKGEPYEIDYLIEQTKADKEAQKVTKSVVINTFEKAKGWKIFSKDGTPLKDIVKGGQVTVLDVSPYATMPSGWEIKAMVAGLVCKRLFQERMLSRKSEEFQSVDKAMHYFSKETKEKQQDPLVWLAIDECFPANTPIITDQGTLTIKQITKKVENKEKLKAWSYNQKTKDFEFQNITKSYKKPKRQLIELTTETGRKIKCTEDHKLFTKKGFQETKDAKELAIPTNIPNKQDKKLIRARLLGHIFGDGWLSNNPKQVGFSGKSNKNDLLLIKKDLKTLGFTSSNIYSRKTSSKITHVSGKTATVNGTSHSINASAKTFDYFKKLGAPVGSKTNIKMLIPKWLTKASKEEKAEFLAALFGADGMAPSQSKTWGGDFNPIRFSCNKHIELTENGVEYTDQLKKLFSDLNIKVSQIKQRRGNIRKDGTKSIKLVITLAKSVDNTIKYLEKVGYRYCSIKQKTGFLWLEYLKARKYVLNQRENLRKKAFQIREKTGWGKIKIAKELNIPSYQVRDWIYKNSGVSMPQSFPNFDKWIKERLKNNIFYEKIQKRTTKSAEPLFDITVNQNHNFIANGVIAHNCHELLPREGKTAASDPLITILREGRQPGISLILATQQPGKIHTDVMTQSDIVLSHRLTAKMDVEALGLLMQSYMRTGLDVELNNLPRQKGAAILFDDNNERLFPIQMRPRFTWHGGSSPTAVKEKKGKADDILKSIKDLD